MSGYLYFKKTGVSAVDAILAQIENAGRMFHHTEQWPDGYPAASDPSLVDRIQAAANDAAEKWRALSERREAPEGAARGGDGGQEEETHP